MLIPVHSGTSERRHSIAMECMHSNLIDELMTVTDEKMAALADNDALTAENIALRKELAEQAKQLATMRAA